MISAEHSGYDYSSRRGSVTNPKLLLTLLVNHLRLHPQRFGIVDQFRERVKNTHRIEPQHQVTLFMENLPSSSRRQFIKQATVAASLGALALSGVTCLWLVSHKKH